MSEQIQNPIDSWQKVQCHSPEFSEVETDAITHLALRNSEVQPALLRVCMAPERNVVASVKGIPLDLFLKTLVKTKTDARIVMAAACTVLSRMHQQDMLHLEAVPRNFVVIANNLLRLLRCHNRLKRLEFAHWLLNATQELPRPFNVACNWR